MNDLADYLEQIVVPTFEEMSRHPDSERHMYLTCVAVYHAVDRMAPPGKSGNIARKWRKASFEFYLVDIIAHHLKHVKSPEEKPNPKYPGIPIGRALGFDRILGLEMRNLYFVVRDAIKFLHEQVRKEVRTDV